MRRWVYGVVAAAALFVAALVAVSYGVSTHSETTLLRACRRHDGTAVYTSPVEGGPLATKCDRPRELHWRQEDLPLPVFVTFSHAEPTPGERDIVGRAFEELNAQLGFEFFVPAAQSTLAKVTVVFGVPAGPGDAPASVRHRLRLDGTAQSAVVIVRNVPDWGLLFRVLVHEFGHVAGLAHDVWEGSVMSREIVDSAGFDNFARVTDADRAVLRELYNPS